MKAADRDLRTMRRLVTDGAADDRDVDLPLPLAILDGLVSLDDDTRRQPTPRLNRILICRDDGRPRWPDRSGE